MKHEAERAAAWNAEALHILKPGIRFSNSSDFLTPTMLAAAAGDGLSVLINSELLENAPTETVWFAISHELRHCWQAQNGVYSFDGYSDAASTDLERYNEQEAEIDAHGWAVLVMQELFGVRPVLKVFTPKLWERIVKRADEIIIEIGKSRGDQNAE